MHDFVTYEEWTNIFTDIKTESKDQSDKTKLQEYIDNIHSLSNNSRQDKRNIANGAIYFLKEAEVTKVSLYHHVF